jgi:hypothetical protein
MHRVFWYLFYYTSERYIIQHINLIKQEISLTHLLESIK